MKDKKAFMLNDRKLIKNIRQLRDIKPDKSWVSSVKEDVLGHQPTFSEEVFAYFALITWKPVLVSITAILTIIIIGGGLLYPFSEGGSSVKGNDKSIAQLSVPLDNLKEQITRTIEEMERQTNNLASGEAEREILHQSITTSQGVVAAIQKIDTEEVLASRTEELKGMNSQFMITFTKDGMATLEQQRYRGLLTIQEIQSLIEIERLYQREEYEEAFVQLWILEGEINSSK